MLDHYDQHSNCFIIDSVFSAEICILKNLIVPFLVVSVSLPPSPVQAVEFFRNIQDLPPLLNNVIKGPFKNHPTRMI